MFCEICWVYFILYEQCDLFPDLRILMVNQKKRKIFKLNICLIPTKNTLTYWFTVTSLKTRSNKISIVTQYQIYDIKYFKKLSSQIALLLFLLLLLYMFHHSESFILSNINLQYGTLYRPTWPGRPFAFITITWNCLALSSRD